MASFSETHEPNDEDDLALAMALSTSCNGAPPATVTNGSVQSPQRKKQKSTTTNSSDLHFNFQYPGNSSILTLPAYLDRHRHFPAISIEHGTSLSLISRGTTMLNDEFSEISPEKSWKKWSKMAIQPYFVAVVADTESSSSSSGSSKSSAGREILSILTFVMDGDVEGGALLDNDPPGRRSRRIGVFFFFFSSA